jgi:transmembrane sensor
MIVSVESDRLLQAATWRARLAEAPGTYIEQFEVWLAQDPQNGEAWKLVQSPWESLGEHATSPGLIRRRQAALAHAHNAGQGHWTRLRRFRFPARLGAAAVVVLVIAMASLLIWQDHRFDVYRTRAGERRVVTLADGSQIALDSQSEVTVRYSAHARELVLVSGQARFDVAHDIERPFSVTADGHKVVATGTAFNVDLLGSDLLVTLIEGHVVVLPQRAGTQAFESAPTVPSSGNSSLRATRGTPDPGFSDRIALEAGEQLVISSSALPSVTRVNVDHATAWESGRLIFEDERLSTVVARVSRYGARPILLDDEQISSLRISGVFHEGDVEGFVSTLVSYLPVRAEQAKDGSVRLSSRKGERGM